MSKVMRLSTDEQQSIEIIRKFKIGHEEVIGLLMQGLEVEINQQKAMIETYKKDFRSEPTQLKQRLINDLNEKLSRSSQMLKEIKGGVKNG